MCPACGHRFDCHDGVTDPGAVPRPGDASICGHCRGLGIWVDERTVRTATDAEVEDLVAKPAVRAALSALAVADDIHQAVAIARRVHARSN
jgi:hypothetical protein